MGEPLQQPVDLTQYDLDATLTGPRELKVSLQATAPEAGEAKSEQTAIWQIEYPAATSQGFYELKLLRRDGGSDVLLFAANVEPTEGDLQRADRRALERELAGANVQFISAAEAQSLASSGAQTEIWWYLLWGVVAVLSGEQALGWFFGQRRT